MTEANVLLIKKGRHPLAELVSDTFVTNDIRFDEIREDVDDDVDPTRIVLLSGANCSGKSTYLKEVSCVGRQYRIAETNHGPLRLLLLFLWRTLVSLAGWQSLRTTVNS